MNKARKLSKLSASIVENDDPNESYFQDLRLNLLSNRNIPKRGHPKMGDG